MGQSIVKRVIQILNDGGIPAQEAQPAGRMVNILVPVAAVSIQSIEQEKREATVRVEIVAMASEGGAHCEDTAMKAYELLRDAGGVCSVERCTFQGKTGVFTMPVLATFSGDAYRKNWVPLEDLWNTFTVELGGNTLSYATAFTATQAVSDPETEELSDMSWNFTVEEWIPAGKSAPESPVGVFLMTVITDATREQFEGCSMTVVQRQMEESGVKQVRKGVAALRTVKTTA